MLANSESGHIMQDTYARDAGGRDDPCANVIPGYRPKDSFTVLHHGEAGSHGMHEGITAEEKARNAALAEKYPNGKVPPDEIRNGMGANASATANYSATGPRNPGTGLDRSMAAANAKNPAHAQAIDERRQQMAQQLSASPAVAGNPALAGKVAANTVNGPNGPQPTQKAIEKATKCIQDKAEQKLQEMQRTTVDKDSTVAKSQASKDAIAAENAKRAKRRQKALDRGDQEQADRLKPIENFSQLPASERKKVLAATEGEVAAREQALANPPQPDTRTPKQKGDDCLEQQGNQLAAVQKTDGSFPPFSGSLPGF